MERPSRLYDRMDWKELTMSDSVSGMIGEDPKFLRDWRGLVLKSLDGPIGTQVIDRSVNPALAALHQSITQAYDANNDQVDAQAINRAAAETERSLSGIFSLLPGISKEDSRKMAVALVDLETTLTLQEPIPQRGRRRGA